MDADAFLFEVRPGTQWLNDIRLSRYSGGSKLYRGNNPQPGTAISYYLKTVPAGEVKITISDYSGKVVRNFVGTKEVGLNRVQWNLRGDPPQRPAGFGNPGEPPADPANAQTQGQAPAGQAQGQAGGGQGRGGGGRGGFANFGPALDPGTYLVKLM